ncbi:hypothetical protein AAFF_G00116080 [Aldrovandia affinis]|uniref:Uncharacterized protein n=1 Tax=Aldrovandia affinis TaxID=143900 RepID=A0AAD7T2L4_9TELE|nr:hypothetical protein AAFF_G00116080 [Aldrovandia affinis]
MNVLFIWKVLFLMFRSFENSHYVKLGSPGEQKRSPSCFRKEWRERDEEQKSDEERVMKSELPALLLPHLSGNRSTPGVPDPSSNTRVAPAASLWPEQRGRALLGYGGAAKVLD